MAKNANKNKEPKPAPEAPVAVQEEAAPAKEESFVEKAAHAIESAVESVVEVVTGKSEDKPEEVKQESGVAFAGHPKFNKFKQGDHNAD